MALVSRLIRSVAAVSDSQGRITFTLGPAEQGYVYQGVVQVPNCPSGALFTATVLSTSWGQWAGPTNFGPIQLWGGETLAVNGVGLTPLTNYVLTFFGVDYKEQDATPIPPAAPTSVVTVETVTVLINGRPTSGSGDPVTIRPPSLTRRLTIIAQSTSANTGPGTYTVKGDTTGAIYGTFIVTHPSTVAATPQFVEIEPSLDPTMTIDFLLGTVGSFKLWVLASTTNPLVDTNPNTPLVTQFAFGQFTSQFDASLSAATSNQALIGAPGAGVAIYLQQITFFTLSCDGPVEFKLHQAGSATGIVRSIVPATGSEQITFPGSFELAANTALQVDTLVATTGTLIFATGTYATGVPH